MSKRDQLEKLRSFNSWIRQSDPEVAEEMADRPIRDTPDIIEEGRSEDGIDEQIAEESIALRRTRPVLPILENKPKLEFVDADDSKIWAKRITDATPIIEKAATAIGRIDLKGAGLDWVGTGFLVHDEIMVTNRHVANEFAVRKGQGFSFKQGIGGQIAASMDFIQEIGSDEERVFKILRALHIEPAPGPDLAFFQVEVENDNGKLAAHVDLSLAPVETENVAVIGYPAYDSRIPEPDLMEKIFGKIYNKKRLAPGAVTRVETLRLLHNCTTLGGNSGSEVMDLNTGQAVGLHFSGSFLTTNYAVRSDIVKTILGKVRSGRSMVGFGGTSRRQGGGEQRQSKSIASTNSSIIQPGTATLTVPVTITVSIGGAPSIRKSIAPVRSLGPADGGGDIEGEEAVAADYRDREGYSSDFLGEGLEVPFPEVLTGSDDILDFEIDGQEETALKYEHFSVVMSRSRRMCFFSAVNIDGNKSKKSARVSWKWDPRIPRSQQIMNECYGNSPKFSRGHMTRREDPGWGGDKTAKRGNEDSMHVTNATPQMQAFNAPIWLALEDYALQHAREDAMKISVFTGPYLDKNDPEMYGVQIPLAFWKIIAFIHDETAQLCATGYEMDQQDNLAEEEFVFGAFTSPQLKIATQVPIRSIEARSGIHFGRLASVDPLAGEEESLTGARQPLMSLDQIRFTRPG